MYYDKLKDYLSEERLKPYLELSKNDKEKAIELYLLFVKINESFYLPLQNVELVIRNCFYNGIASKYGTDWIINKEYLLTGLSRKKDLLLNQIKLIYKNNNEGGNGRFNLNINDIISNVTFGFWTTLLDDDYEVEIWRPCLRKIFNSYYFNTSDKLLRKDVKNKLNEIKKIRNKIFHHENLLKFDLNYSYESIIFFIRLFSDDLAKFTLDNSSFEYNYENIINFSIQNDIQLSSKKPR